VQTAFGLVATGPTSRTRVVAVEDGLRAGHATDRRIPLLRQRVDRDVVVVDVAGDVDIALCGERIDLHETAQITGDDRRVVA
jgi:hypothetical protein